MYDVYESHGAHVSSEDNFWELFSLLLQWILGIGLRLPGLNRETFTRSAFSLAPYTFS